MVSAAETGATNHLSLLTSIGGSVAQRPMMRPNALKGNDKIGLNELQTC